MSNEGGESVANKYNNLSRRGLAPPIEKYNYIEHFFQALNYSNMKIASIIMVVFHTVTNSHTTTFNLFMRNGQFTSVFSP